MKNTIDPYRQTRSRAKCAQPDPHWQLLQYPSKRESKQTRNTVLQAMEVQAQCNTAYALPFHPKAVHTSLANYVVGLEKTIHRPSTGPGLLCLD
eukprot:704874-Pelagomonas_calceolata.AAC.5